jgi:hypothetical protein
MKSKVNMINAIIRDYRKSLEQAYYDAYGYDYNPLEIDSQVSNFLEQVQFFYSDNQILELYNLIK